MIVGLGAPCTGTGYAAKTLANSGLDVRHEVLGDDGVVYWALAARDGTAPKNHGWFKGSDWSRIDWETAKVFQVARSPLKSLNSFAAHSSFDTSSVYMWNKIRRFTSKNWKPVDHNHDSFLNSAILLMGWSELVQNSNPEMIYRVDRPVDNKKLSDFLGVEIKPFRNKKYNTKKASKKYSYTYAEFAKYPLVGANFADWCDWLGYPEDAKKVRSVL